MPPQDSGEPSQESNPEAAFKAHVATLNEKLSLILCAPSGERSEECDPKAAFTANVAIQIDELRTAYLRSATKGRNVSSSIRPSIVVDALPVPPWHKRKISRVAPRRTLRPTTAHRKRPGRAILVAGFAVSLMTLLFWGAATMIQHASNEQISWMAEAVDTTTRPALSYYKRFSSQPDAAVTSLAPTTGKRDLGTSQKVTLQKEIDNTPQQIAVLTKSARSPDNEITEPTLDPQIAKILLNSATPEIDAGGALPSLEHFLFEPSQYIGHEVIVTGSVISIAQHFWLQSAKGQNMMSIDVEGLRPGDLEKLNVNVTDMDLLIQFRIRIRGSVVPLESDKYLIAATEIELIE